MNSTDPGFPLIDSDCFLENMCGDPVFALDTLETSLKEWEDQVNQIRNLNEDSDKELAKLALHSLRGGSSNFVASSLGELLLQMELECDGTGVKSVLPHLEAFEVEATAYRDGLLCLREELRARL